MHIILIAALSRFPCRRWIVTRAFVPSCRFKYAMVVEWSKLHVRDTQKNDDSRRWFMTHANGPPAQPKWTTHNGRRFAMNNKYERILPEHVTRGATAYSHNELTVSLPRT